MTTPTSATASPRKKRRIGRIIAIILSLLIILLVTGYFVATSAMFLKGVILPKAGAAMNASITVSDASISPFSQVVFKNLEVKPLGKETLFKAGEIRARYNLRDIIGGKITVEEVTVISPVITIVEAADGSSNLDPITKQAGQTKSKPENESKKGPEKAPVLNIKNISLKDALVRQTKNLAGGGHETTEISNLNFSIDQLSNGQPGKLNLAADIRMERAPSANSTNAAPGSLNAKLGGAVDYKLTADVQPESVKGNLHLDVSDAKGSLADLAKLGATFDCDLTPTDIRELKFQFSQADQALGALRISGPLSFANLEGKLKVELSAIDRHVLNLAGAASGIDFNSTVINASHDIAISQKGNLISVNGQVNVNQLSLTKKVEKQTTPTMNLQAAYQISVDQSAKSALIQAFDVSGTQNQQKMLSVSLSKPMPISWGGASSTPENTTLKLAITDLNLDDWKSFAADVAPSGKLNVTLNVVSQQAGKQLSVDLTSRLDDLSAKFGSNQISNADLELKTKVAIADMKKVSLTSYEVQLSQAKQPALTLGGSGTLDLESKDADIKATMSGVLAQLFKIVVLPDLSAAAGELKFDGQITQRKDSQLVKGNFALVDFSGAIAGSALNRFSANFDADLEMKEQNLQIRKLSGVLQQAGQAGGAIDLKGNYNTGKKSGDIEVKIADINQNALRPFLAKSLGEKQLVTISIDANTTAHLQENESSFKGHIDLKNFVVRDPKKKEADEPLNAQFQLDAGMQGQVIDLRQFQIALKPTARAKNELNIKGQFDMSITNALKGKLLVQSDAFDVTPFYDLYAVQPPPANAETKSAQQAPQTTAASNVEPEPVTLPIGQFIAELNVGQFYLREIEIKDWHATAKIEGSHVVLNPFQLSLNNAPVKMEADLNLGVKGYVYNFSASMDGVPLEPLANSFMPEKKGAYTGTILANANIKGAGTTGVNLKKTLSGQMGFTFTNANIQIVNPKYKNILVPISLALQIPEIASSPINWLDARLNMGDGKIELANFAAVSESYRATVQAIIPIADVLMDSPLNKIPVGFELRKGLADSARLGGGTVSSDGKYVKLPNLISLAGTIGNPKSEMDKKGLTALTLQAGAGLIGGDAGKILKGVGGLFGGGQQTTNATTSTNNVHTNQPSQGNQLLNNALDFFKKKKK